MSEFYPEHDLPNFRHKPAVVPKKTTKYGHEVPLKTFIRDKTKIMLTMMKGEARFGIVTQFDNWTITINETFPGVGMQTYFKHAIISFGAAEHE
jgi:sRNA-binding regulator protein Hfq